MSLLLANRSINIENPLIGTLWEDLFSRSSLGSNWTTSGSPTISLDGSDLTLSGGVGNFLNYLYYNAYIFGLEDFDVEILYKVGAYDGGSNHIVFGFGNATNWAGKFYQYQVINTAGSTCGRITRWANGAGNINITGTQTMTIVQNDEMKFFISKRKNVITLTYYNLTTPNNTSGTHTFDVTYPQTNTSYQSMLFYIYATRGTQIIHSVKMTSPKHYYSNAEIFGDSITFGSYAGSIANRFADLVDRFAHNFILHGGPSERVYDKVQAITKGDEFSKFTAHTTLLFIGTNDLGSGRTEAQLEADYDTFVDHLISLGRENIYHISALPRSGLSAINTFNTWLSNTYGANYIDINTEFNDGSNGIKATYDCGDDIHPNSTGHAKIAELIEAYFNG